MSFLSKAFQPVNPLNSGFVSRAGGSANPLTQMFSLNSDVLNKAPSPYSFYLDILSQWPTAPALASMWLVVINLRSVSALMNNPAALVSLFDSGDFQPWEISQGTVDDLTKPEYQQTIENLMGCVFAQEVSIPGETITATQENLNWGGLQTPYIIKGRNSFDKIKMSFLETNASFADLVIRPWIVLASHLGLIARSPGSPKNVKCDFMDVIQFAKTGPYSSVAIRKIVRYYDVVPVTLDSLTLSHLEEGLKRRNVSFIYNGYSVMEAGTANMM